MAITRAGSVTTASQDITDLAYFSSAELASMVTDKTGSGVAVFGTGPTISKPLVSAAMEKTVVSATQATGTINLNALSGSVLYYTSNASGYFNLNIRGDSSTTLNSVLASVGDSITCVFMCTNGSTPYYATGFTIDGTSVTPKWQEGVDPTNGTPNAVDTYTLTIVKTSTSPLYAVFGSFVSFV